MNDIYQSLCIHRPATLAFGLPVTEVRKRLASLSAIAAKSGEHQGEVRRAPSRP